MNKKREKYVISVQTTFIVKEILENGKSISFEINRISFDYLKTNLIILPFLDVSSSGYFLLFHSTLSAFSL